MVEESYSTQRWDHPGIVAGICRQMSGKEYNATSYFPIGCEYA